MAAAEAPRGDGGDGSAWADCAETVERLYSFLDGELTEERRAVIARHLDECRPCLGAYDFEVDLRKLLASRCRDRIPDGLRSRILAALQQEQALLAQPPAEPLRPAEA